MKICKLCGQDCSQLPRVKDAAGHYYCKTCHSAAMEQRARREQEESAALGVAAASGFDDAADGNDDYSVLSEILNDAPSAAPVGRRCSSCGTGLAADAHVCTNCGMNLDSGKQMKVQVSRAKSASTGGQVWPIVVGILSIVIGLADGGLRTYAAVEAFQARDARGVGGWLHIALAFALVYGGIKLLMRSPSSFKWLKQWATVKLVLGFTCFGVAFASIAASSSMADGFARGAGLEEFQLNQQELFVLIGVEFIWYVSWALFLAIWLRRSKVEADAGQW